MLSLVRGGGRLLVEGIYLALGISVASPVHWPLPTITVQLVDHEGRFKHYNLGEGTLGWAEYGLYPGLYGFSLRWHPGYGYGRYALGVGADGGYPFYGGPGYPHEPPHLRRFGPTEPYAYYGGPGYPISGCSNFYQGIGGLVVDKPVVSVGEPGDFGYVGRNGERNPGADFGHFTGALPYPTTYLAPNAAAATGSSGAGKVPQTHDAHSYYPGEHSEAFYPARGWKRVATGKPLKCVNPTTFASPTHGFLSRLASGRCPHEIAQAPNSDADSNELPTYIKCAVATR